MHNYLNKEIKMQDDKFTSKIDRIKSTIEYIQKDIDNIKSDCYQDIATSTQINNNIGYETSNTVSKGNFKERDTENNYSTYNYENNVMPKLKEKDNDDYSSKRERNKISRENSATNFSKKLNYNYSDSNLISKIGLINENVVGSKYGNMSNNIKSINHYYSNSNSNTDYKQFGNSNNHNHINNEVLGYVNEDPLEKDININQDNEYRDKQTKSKIKNDKYNYKSNKYNDSNEVQYEYIYKELTKNNEYKIKKGIKIVDYNNGDLDLKNSKSKSKSKVKQTNRGNERKDKDKKLSVTERPKNNSHLYDYNFYGNFNDRSRPITTNDIKDFEKISNRSKEEFSVESLKDKINYLERQNHELKNKLGKPEISMNENYGKYKAKSMVGTNHYNYNSAVSNTIDTSVLNGEFNNIQEVVAQNNDNDYDSDRKYDLLIDKEDYNNKDYKDDERKYEKLNHKCIKKDKYGYLDMKKNGKVNCPLTSLQKNRINLFDLSNLNKNANNLNQSNINSKNKNPFNNNYLQSNYTITTNNNYEEIVLDTKTIERNVQILAEIQCLLNAKSFEDIIPCIKDSQLRLKDEFICKVEDLYKKVIPSEIRKITNKENNNKVDMTLNKNTKNNDLNNHNKIKIKQKESSKNKRNNIDYHEKDKEKVKQSNVEIKELWSWIKSLVRFQETTLCGTKIDNNNYDNDNNEFDNICCKIMQDNQLSSTKDLKLFLDKAINSLVSGKKKVDKIKELLFKEPASKDKISSYRNKSGKAEKN